MAPAPLPLVASAAATPLATLTSAPAGCVLAPYRLPDAAQMGLKHLQLHTLCRQTNKDRSVSDDKYRRRAQAVVTQPFHALTHLQRRSTETVWVVSLTQLCQQRRCCDLRLSRAPNQSPHATGARQHQHVRAHPSCQSSYLRGGGSHVVRCRDVGSCPAKQRGNQALSNGIGISVADGG